MTTVSLMAAALILGAASPSASASADTPWSPPPLLDVPLDEEPLPPPPIIEAEVPSVATHESAHWAAAFEVGVPDGLAVALWWQPFAPMRASAAVLTNGTTAGVRGGLALHAAHWPLRPSVGVELGHVFRGDPGLALGAMVGSDFGPLLSDVSYDFATGYLGVELGWKRVALLLRGGASHVEVTLPRVAEFLARETGEDIRGEPVRIRLFHPSARVGVVVHLD